MRHRRRDTRDTRAAHPPSPPCIVSPAPSARSRPRARTAGMVSRSTVRVISRPPSSVSPVQKSCQVPRGRYSVREVAPCSTTGATSRSRPHRYSSPRATADGVIGIVQPQRADHRHPGLRALAHRAVQIRHQPVAQLQILSADRLDLRRCAVPSGPDRHVGRLHRARSRRVFQPQGRRSFQVRPCERNSGLNAANWNQRTYSSPVNSCVGTKPPMSVPQYGIPLSPTLTAIGTWFFSVSHSELTSPDHRNDRVPLHARRAVAMQRERTLVRPVHLRAPPSTCGCAPGARADRARRLRRATSHRRRSRALDGACPSSSSAALRRAAPASQRSFARAAHLANAGRIRDVQHHFEMILREAGRTRPWDRGRPSRLNVNSPLLVFHPEGQKPVPR